MQRPGNALRQDLDDSEHAPLTPRGLAAPPPQAPHRPDHDARRPATIRIEAGKVTPLPARGATATAPQVRRDTPAPMHAAAGERLQHLVLSQGLLFNAFVLLLVFGWSAPLPGRRLLLGAFAIGGIVLAVLIHVALHQVRRHPSSGGARATTETGRFGGLAARALPAALASTWIALGIYALALPPTANAFQDPRSTTAPAHRGTSPTARQGDGVSAKDSAAPSDRRGAFVR